MLDERALSLSLGSEAAVWRDLSGVIPARVYVLLSSEEAVVEAEANAQAATFLHLRVVETRTGIVLGGATVEGEWNEEALAQLDDAGRAAIAKTTVPAEDRVYLAFLGVSAEVESATLEREAMALSALVRRRLAAQPAVTLLERREVALLAQEGPLTGLPPQLRTSSLIVRGGLRFDAATGMYALALSATRPGGDTADSAAPLDLADWRAAADEAVRRVLAASAVAAIDVPAMGRAEEAERLRARSLQIQSYYRRFNTRGAVAPLTEAVALAEAALALDPTDATRRTLIDACWATANTYLPLSGDRVLAEMMVRANEVDIERVRAMLSRLDPAALSQASYQPLFQSRRPGDLRFPRDVRPIVARYRELYAERRELYVRMMADAPPIVRHRFYGDVLDHVYEWARTPEEHLDLSVRFLALAEATWRELMTDPAFAEKWRGGELLPVNSEMPFYQGYAHLYGPLLAHLDKHDNPMMRQHALAARIVLEMPDADAAAREILTRVLDPRSDVNRFVARHEPVWSQDGGVNAAMTRLLDHGGERTLLDVYRKGLRMIEAQGASDVLCRWSYLTFTVLRRAGPPPQLLDQIERVLQQHPPALASHAGSSEKILQLVHDMRRGEQRQRPAAPSPWDAFTIEKVKLPPVASGERELLAAVPMTTEAGQPVDEPYYILLMATSTSKVMEQPRGKRVRLYEKYRLSADCADLRLLSSGPEPRLIEAMGSSSLANRWAYDAVVVGDWLFFTQSHKPGLFMLDDTLHFFGEEAGVLIPEGGRLLSIAGRLFVGWAGGLAEFDLDQRRYNVLASARATSRRSALDDASNYVILGMVGESDESAFWFTVVPPGWHSSNTMPGSAATGVWRYDLATGRLASCDLSPQAAEEGLTYLAWVDGELLALARRSPRCLRIDRQAMTVDVDPRVPAILPRMRGGKDLFPRLTVGFQPHYGTWSWSQTDHAGYTFAATPLQVRLPDQSVWVQFPPIAQLRHLIPAPHGVTGVASGDFWLIHLPREEETPTKNNTGT